MSKVLPFEDPESGPDYRRMARAIRFLAEHYLRPAPAGRGGGGGRPVALPFPASVHALCRRQPEKLSSAI